MVLQSKMTGNENLKKTIMNGPKLKSLMSRKSVKIAEEKNTVNNFDEILKKKMVVPISDEFLPTPPQRERASQKTRALTVLDIVKKSIKEENSKEVESNVPLTIGCSQIINQKEIEKAAIPNFDVLNNTVNQSQIASVNANVTTDNKQNKTCTEKRLLQSALHTPKTNKSVNSQSNMIFQFSSILDPNNDNLSDTNTARIIKDNKGLSIFLLTLIFSFKGVSLFLFSSDNRFRITCKKIIKHKGVQLLILAIAIASCFAMAFKDPYLPPDSENNTIVKNFQIAFFVFFLIEFLLKLVSYGFLLNGPRSCMRKYEDLLDFFLLILNFYEFSTGKYSNFKSLRMLKFFFIGPYKKSLRIVTKTLVLCIPNLIKIGIITVYIMFFFSFFAVKILKDRLYMCTNINFEDLIIDTKSDCFDYGGDWIKKDFTFDNIADGLKTLFAICSTEGWIALS